MANGRHSNAATMRGALRGRGGFTLMELMVVVTILGLIAGLAIPSFLNYVRRSRTIEASGSLRRIFDASIAYYFDEHAAQDGRAISRTFPAAASPTPAASCCGQPGDKCDSMAAFANDPTWQALNFQMEDPHRYVYSYASSGDDADARFTARANGDLDCDGVFSTFERVGWVDAEGQAHGGASLSRHMPLE